MPANVLSLADVPPPMQRPPLKVGPPGFGGADVDALAEGFAKLAEAGGDEFMAVLPWKGAIKEPSQHPKISKKKPKCKMALEWAYGYSCFEPNHRSNVRYNNAGGIVYHTAAIGVIYDKKKNHQKFNIGDHTDDIMSFAMSSGAFVVGGGGGGGGGERQMREKERERERERERVTEAAREPSNGTRSRHHAPPYPHN